MERERCFIFLHVKVKSSKKIVFLFFLNITNSDHRIRDKVKKNTSSLKFQVTL